MSPQLDEMLPGGVGDEKRTSQVDGDDSIPQICGHLGERRRTQQTGVVDDDVHTPVGLDRRIDRGGGTGLGGDVGGDCGRPTTRRDDLGSDVAGCGGVEVIDHHGRASVGQQPGV